MAGSVATAQDEGKNKLPKPTEQYQTVLKEFSAASRIIWEEPTDQERQNAVARVDKLPQKLLDLVQNNPQDPIALDALIQVVTMEYWLNTHTSHPGWARTAGRPGRSR